MRDGKWPPLKDDLHKGDPVGKLDARDIGRVMRFINTLQVIGGTLVMNPDGRDCKLVIGQDAMAGADIIVYLGGVKFGPFADKDKPYIRVRVDQNTVEEHAGPIPNPFPPGEEWYDKRRQSGSDIHVTRFG
jgi:hypothetical protein